MTTHNHDKYVANVAERLQRNGYSITLPPLTEELAPFFGAHQPDLAATRGTEKLLVEVSGGSERIDVERLQERAQLALQHGWRVVLITPQDIVGDNFASPDDILSVSEIESLANWTGQVQMTESLQLVSRWIAFEALVRKIAIRESIPIERLPTRSVINRLYDLGFLSWEEYQDWNDVQPVRNRVVHGFRHPGTLDAKIKIARLIDALVRQASR